MVQDNYLTIPLHNFYHADYEIKFQKVGAVYFLDRVDCIDTVLCPTEACIDTVTFKYKMDVTELFVAALDNKRLKANLLDALAKHQDIGLGEAADLFCLQE